MQKFLLALNLVLLIGCAPAECTPAAPLTLSAISGLQLIPDTTSVTLRSGTKPQTSGSSLASDYSCPTFDLTNVTAQLGGAPLSSSATGGPEWAPPSVWFGGSGLCECDPALMGVEGETPGAAAGQPISSARFDVTLSQGSTQLRATYLEVSNSVRVVEVPSTDLQPNRRLFRFFSEFNRTYVLHKDPGQSRAPWGTNVKVAARFQGADVSVSVLSSSSLLVLDLSGPADEFTFEVDRLFHDIQSSDCRGAASCEPLRVIAPTQTLKL